MKKIFLVLILILSLTACQDLNDPNNYVNKQVQDFAIKYLLAINNQDRKNFKELLSPNFKEPVDQYLENRFANEYTEYSIAGIQRVGETISVKIDFKKESVYVSSNVTNVPLTGWTLEKRELIFNKQKQLLSDRTISIQEKYDQNNLSPMIHEFYPEKLVAKQGGNLRYYFTVQKRQKLSVLKIIFDGQVITGEILDTLLYNNHHTVAVAKNNKNLFPVELVIVEGLYDNADPSKLHDVNLAVRKLAIPITN